MLRARHGLTGGALGVRVKGSRLGFRSAFGLRVRYVVGVYGPRQEGSILDVNRNTQGSLMGRVRQLLWGMRATWFRVLGCRV